MQYLDTYLSEFPSTQVQQIQFWQQHTKAISELYTSKQTGFVPFLAPDAALDLPAAQVMYLFEKRFGPEKVQLCLDTQHSYTSPVAQQPDSAWLQAVTMVGVNVRTIGSFWKLVKYALTLPSTISSIHILPIWECGVADSLYGMASWQLNDEFFDNELYKTFPHLNTVDKQLKICINFLHLMGKSVGLDVVPHTDRYSEIVLANPSYFEWLQRKDFQIKDHKTSLIHKVEAEILAFVVEEGSASGDYFPRKAQMFFDNDTLPEQTRIEVLFGKANDKYGRNARRAKLIDRMYHKGFEPAPATMGPPYRGLEVDSSEEAKTIDAQGRVWRDYKIINPGPMSRAFGPLTRYRLFESKNDNKNWELDFEKPRKHVHQYVAERYGAIITAFNFDFMRGDMSHVQMNPAPNYENVGPYYDIHQFVKKSIAATRPYFGYFAESFLEKDDFMAYGSEKAHLEASNCDVALGNLQGYGVQEPMFLVELCKYLELATHSSFKPSLTIFTADKDDPRFDESFNQATELRYFLALFFRYLPSYTAMGYELRDQHLPGLPNEYYSKLYVFHMDHGPKATSGPYLWGSNHALFKKLLEMHLLSEQFFGEGATVSLLTSPDTLKSSQLLKWEIVHEDRQYQVWANFSVDKSHKLPKNKAEIQYKIYPEKTDLKPFDAVIFTLTT